MTSESAQDTRIDEAAERIYQSGILDEIAAEAVEGTLADRDVMEDALAIARLALKGEPR